MSDTTPHGQNVQTGIDPVSLALASGGGVIPERGEYNSKAWAQFLGVTEKTVRTYFKQANVKCRRLGGGEAYVSAENLRAAIPLEAWGDDDSEAPKEAESKKGKRRR